MEESRCKKLELHAVVAGNNMSGWEEIAGMHDGYGYVPAQKAQWFRGPEWPDCPRTYEVERHEAKCQAARPDGGGACKAEVYLDAGSATYRCPICETKDAQIGQSGRTELEQGSVVDWHRAPFLKSNPALLFGDLNIDVKWKNLVDTVQFATGPRELGQPRLVCSMAQPEAMDHVHEGHKTEPMCASVNGIRRRTEEKLFGSLDLSYFDTAHIAQYRDGDDHACWALDDDVYGAHPITAIVSFGGTRDVVLRLRADPSRQICFALGAGDLFVTSGATQRRYEHKLRKAPATWKTRGQDPRISITFRRFRHAETAPVPLRDWPALRPAVAAQAPPADMEMD